MAEFEPEGSELETGAMADAMAFLKGILSEALLPVRTIEMEAKGAGHSMDIIRRTKKKLNIEARKDQGTFGVWRWSLPDK